MSIPSRGVTLGGGAAYHTRPHQSSPSLAALAAARQGTNTAFTGVPYRCGPASDDAQPPAGTAGAFRRADEDPLATLPWSAKSSGRNNRSAVGAAAAARTHPMTDSNFEAATQGRSMQHLSGTLGGAHRSSCDYRSPPQNPGDSSMVFVMSEDSELKVLAGGASPPTVMSTQPCLAPSAAPSSSPSVTQAALMHSTRKAVNSGNTTATYRAAPSDVLQTTTTTECVENGADAYPLMHRQGHCGGRYDPRGVALTTAAAGHQQPHTPSQRSASLVEASDADRPSGGRLSKPSVLVSTKPYPAGVPGAPTSRLGVPPAAAAPVYRTSPHDLRSLPDRHVCPTGGMLSVYNARGKVPSNAGSAVAVAADSLDVGGAANSGGGGAARWAPQHIPYVSLFPAAGTGEGAGGGDGPPVAYGGHRRAPGASALSSMGGVAATTVPQPPAPAPQLTSAGTNNGADARSQRSSTPLPPASLPIEKSVTAAQRLAVQEEVQQELYLNYTAVPIPVAMVNHGDTEERQRRLEQRRKQILYGKETEGYLKYTSLIPRVCDREYHNPLHAMTPRPEYDCSKRQFDRVLNAWRRQLHQWDDCDLENVEDRFRPLGKATLLELGLCLTSPNGAPTMGSGDGSAVAPSDPPPPPPPPSSVGVMHSIAHVAAMANQGAPDGALECHSRSPVFTESSPTSGLYSSTSLSMRLSSGRVVSMATACTPSRPQLSEGAEEGPQVDESFFLHMNSHNSRMASPFHPTYSGTGHVGVGSGGVNGRTSACSHYQHVMMRGGGAYAHGPTNGGTPGQSYPPCTGLTPAHRPTSRAGMPHHITAIFGSDYELMTPSGSASPSSLLHNPRYGNSPYPLGEPWVPHRRSPTCAIGSVHGVGGHQVPLATLSGVTAANGSGTMMMVSGARGESPQQPPQQQQATKLALIPSTSLSHSGGFANSPYGYRVHSPVQPQGTAQQSPQQPTSPHSIPLTCTPGKPSPAFSTNATFTAPDGSSVKTRQRSGSYCAGTMEGQQQQSSAATGVNAASRSLKGRGVGGAPTSWGPQNVQVRTGAPPPSPNLAATPPTHT